jgi:hypothetical protein
MFDNPGGDRTDGSGSMNLEKRRAERRIEIKMTPLTKWSQKGGKLGEPYAKNGDVRNERRASS